MRARFLHTIDDLHDDFRAIEHEAPRAMNNVVREGIRTGNTVAKDNARRENGTRSHSKKYPGSFSPEMHGSLSSIDSQARMHSGEYGPVAVGQGELAPILENGSRNGNKPQKNLARSADLIAGSFGREAGEAGERLFLEHGWR